MIDFDEILIGLKEIPTATIANALDDVGKFINSSASICDFLMVIKLIIDYFFIVL